MVSPVVAETVNVPLFVIVRVDVRRLVAPPVQLTLPLLVHDRPRPREPLGIVTVDVAAVTSAPGPSSSPLVQLKEPATVRSPAPVIVPSLNVKCWTSAGPVRVSVVSATVSRLSTSSPATVALEN